MDRGKGGQQLRPSAAAPQHDGCHAFKSLSDNRFAQTLPLLRRAPDLLGRQTAAGIK